jgi:hypothetical protein
MIAGTRTSKLILLIDDAFPLREMTLTLAGEGYMVATASDGEDALRRRHSRSSRGFFSLSEKGAARHVLRWAPG